MKLLDVVRLPDGRCGTIVDEVSDVWVIEVAGTQTIELVYLPKLAVTAY